MALPPRPTDPSSTTRSVRGLRRRRVAAVAGTGFILTVGALALAACGSDSSSAKIDPSPTTNTVVKKQAGHTHMELVVTNGSGKPLPVKVCTQPEFSACLFNALADGAIAKEHDDGAVQAAIKYPDGSITYIEAQNPLISGEYVALSSDFPGGSDNSTGRLNIGVTGQPGAMEPKTVYVRDHKYELSRDPTGDYIEMKVLIK